VREVEGSEAATIGRRLAAATLVASHRTASASEAAGAEAERGCN
jgi:hypothetical protein